MTTSRLRMLDGPPYERSMRVLPFTVDGLPQPQGSKSASINRRTGRIIMREAVKDLVPWRDRVRAVIAAQMAIYTPPDPGWPLLGPISIDLVFTMKRPKNAPKRRRTYPTVKPDTDKLVRAVLDAGSPNPRKGFGGLWADDSQVVDVHAAKVYPLEAPGALDRPGLYAVVYLIGDDSPWRPPGDQPALQSWESV